METRNIGVTQRYKVRTWSDHNQSKYAFYITHGKGVYGIEFNSFEPQLVPSNFDYQKVFNKKVENLDKSGADFSKFDILGILEHVEVPEGNKVIRARFLMPGYINQVFIINIDPEKQDIRGAIALKVTCYIRRVDNVKIPPFARFDT